MPNLNFAGALLRLIISKLYLRMLSLYIFILSAAKNLLFLSARPFASLRVTVLRYVLNGSENYEDNRTAKITRDYWH